MLFRIVNDINTVILYAYPMIVMNASEIAFSFFNSFIETYVQNLTFVFRSNNKNLLQYKQLF